MIRLSFVVIVLMACVACATQNPGEFSRPGPYVGISVVGAGSNFDNTQDEDLDDSVGTVGVSGRVGYKLWDRAALEVVGEGGLVFEGDNEEATLWNVLLQGKMFFGEERWQPYVFAGGGWGEASFDELNITIDGFLARGGLGLQFYANANWVVFVEGHYTLGFGDMEDAQYVAGEAGVMFRF
jgi:hypothetical protein